MHFNQFDHILEQIQQFIQMGGWVSILLALVCGLALTYAGLKVYWLGVFLCGMFMGAMLGGGIGAGAGAADAGLIGAGLAGAFLGGILAVVAVQIAVVLLGMLAGSLLALAGGVNEPIVVFLIAGACGGLTIALHQLAIILSTAVSGAVLLTWSIINGISLLEHGSMAYAQHSPVSYGMRITKSALDTGNLENALQTASGDLLLFLFFFITGVCFQLNFDRVIGALFLRGKKSGPPLQKKIRAQEESRSNLPAPKDIPEKRIGSLDKLPKRINHSSSFNNHPGHVWTVSLFEGGQMVGQQQLQPGEYMLGREPGVDLVLNDAAVSRQHLHLRVSDEHHLMVQDMKSSNGTWRLGRERIVLEQPDDGDWYQMGTAQIIFKKQMQTV